MSGIFARGMSGLTPFVGCFGINASGYPSVAIGSAGTGWRRECLSAENFPAFQSGLRSVFEEALSLPAFREGRWREEVPVAGTMWTVAFEGEDRMILSRPRYSIRLDLSIEPWSDLLELRKEHRPASERPRFISQRIRWTRNSAEEPFREIKEMSFAREDLSGEFGSDERALGMLEHQIMMQFQFHNFRKLERGSGYAIALDAAEPPVQRWRRVVGSVPARPMKSLDFHAPTPAEGVPVTDPEFPFRVLLEQDAARESLRLYMSRRHPGLEALSLDLGLRRLWERVEDYAERKDRIFSKRM